MLRHSLTCILMLFSSLRSQQTSVHYGIMGIYPCIWAYNMMFGCVCPSTAAFIAEQCTSVIAFKCDNA